MGSDGIAWCSCCFCGGKFLLLSNIKKVYVNKKEYDTSFGSFLCVWRREREWEREEKKDILLMRDVVVVVDVVRVAVFVDVSERSLRARWPSSAIHRNDE